MHGKYENAPKSNKKIFIKKTTQVGKQRPKQILKNHNADNYNRNNTPSLRSAKLV